MTRRIVRVLIRVCLAVSVPELVWTSPEHIQMGALDKVGQPGGLGWPGSMRLGTGSTLLGMVSYTHGSRGFARAWRTCRLMPCPKVGNLGFEGGGGVYAKQYDQSPRVKGVSVAHGVCTYTSNMQAYLYHVRMWEISGSRGGGGGGMLNPIW